MTAAFILVFGCAAHPKTICKRPQKITAEYFAHIYVFSGPADSNPRMQEQTNFPLFATLHFLAAYSPFLW